MAKVTLTITGGNIRVDGDKRSARQSIGCTVVDMTKEKADALSAMHEAQATIELTITVVKR